MPRGNTKLELLTLGREDGREEGHMKRMGQSLIIAIPMFLLVALIAQRSLGLLCAIPFALVFSMVAAGLLQREIETMRLVKSSPWNRGAPIPGGGDDQYTQLKAASFPYWLIRFETLPVSLIKPAVALIPEDEHIEAATCGYERGKSDRSMLVIVTNKRLIVGSVPHGASLRSAVFGLKPQITTIPIGRVTSVSFEQGHMKSAIVIRAANLEDVVVGVPLASLFGARERGEAFVRCLTEILIRNAAS
ncbi:MAG: PH domain-containing protein [Verrucomicrobiales bacterium]